MLRTLALASIALPSLCACQGVVWGNLVVLALTVGIFMGTVTLGRARD